MTFDEWWVSFTEGKTFSWGEETQLKMWAKSGWTYGNEEGYKQGFDEGYLEASRIGSGRIG